MSLLARFLEQASAQPERPAIVEGNGRTISYGDLELGSARLAATLARRGVIEGDRVLVAVWPGIDLYVGLAAVWRVGAVAVFPEPATGIAGLRHAAKVARPKALLAGRSIRWLAWLLPEARPIGVRLDPGERRGGRLQSSTEPTAGAPAMISFTSGTSGPPKGIVRSHGTLLAQHAALSPLIAPSKDREIDLVAFPAFVLSCLGHGTTAVTPCWSLRRHDRAKPIDIIRQISDYGVTRALLPPVLIAALAGHRLPGSLHRMLTGGGPVYPDVVARLFDSTPKMALTVVYGSTEAEPISHVAVETMEARHWAAAASGAGLPVGMPVPGLRVRIVDNEIVVAGPQVVGGYLDPARDRETKIRDGDTLWHRTGDAGRLDDEGRLWLLGRLGSVVGGHHPFAVESAARTWPGVRAAALVGVHGRALLFLAGDRDRQDEWRRRAAKLVDVEVVVVQTIPMDRRHRSKPDVAALTRRRWTEARPRALKRQ